MNLMQLRYFNAVCTYGTVSGAAEYLHIAQPSLSNSVKELEKEFGVILFKRQHKGMMLTAEGRVLLDMSRDILERADRIEKVMNDMGRDRKTLKLGVPPMTGSLILSGIYRDFLSENGDINLEIIECGKQEMNRKIIEDQLDMAFISHNQPIDSGLSSVLAGRLEIVCGATLNSPISCKEHISPKDLKGVPLVMFEDGFYQTTEIKKWFTKEEITPDILMQTSQLSTMLSIITDGTAIGFVFKKLIEKNRDIISVPMSPKIEVNISLVWKKDKYYSGAMKKFKEFLINRNIFE